MIVDLTSYELDALIDLHRDKQFDYGSREQYIDAEYHKTRAIELKGLKEKPVDFNPVKPTQPERRG